MKHSNQIEIAMQRWFFGNSNEAAPADSSQGPVSTAAATTNNGRLHTFRVLVNQNLEPGERVAVTGECSSLGRWLPAHCVQLNRENGELITVNSINKYIIDCIRCNVNHD